MFAVRQNDPHMIKEIVKESKGLDQDQLAQCLHVTARKGYEESTTVLLESGVHPDVHDLGGFTAIMLASKCGHVNIIRLLTQYKCNVNKANYRVRATAIHWAAINGHMDCVKVGLIVSFGN